MPKPFFFFLIAIALVAGTSGCNLRSEEAPSDAPLVVPKITSSDEEVVRVVSPAADALLPSQKKCLVELQGKDFTSAKPKSAKIEVRYESSDGPVIYELPV